MITGDYPATACTIAQQAGLDASEVLTGDAIEPLDDSELARRARTAGRVRAHHARAEAAHRSST